MNISVGEWVILLSEVAGYAFKHNRELGFIIIKVILKSGLVVEGQSDKESLNKLLGYWWRGPETPNAPGPTVVG